MANSAKMIIAYIVILIRVFLYPETERTSNKTANIVNMTIISN